MYTCGPTVYDHAHIGNLSSYVFADTLRRTLSLAGFDVQHVMNYTDVDDKTIRRSREKYPADDPHAALSKLTGEYIKRFNDDMRSIGNDLNAIQFARATDPNTIQGMQKLITQLHDAGFAYIADDGVYFSIDAYRKAGKTYGQLLEITTKNTSEARIQNDEYDKESVHDFALWKKQKTDEPAWPFTLNGQNLSGRPGWHIECSVMTEQNLGQPFDIHTGGVDLIFPHHENEIAQSTALAKNPLMAQIFAHNEHVLVAGKKMSKSLQNFHTLADVVAKGFDPLAFRLKILQSHYRSQVNFTWESVEAAQNLLQRLRAWADQKHQPAAQRSDSSTDTYAPELKRLLATVQEDLNTPLAITVLVELVQDDEAKGVDVQKIQPLLNIVDRQFGLDLSQRPDVSEELKAVIAARETAREAQDWAKSDELRNTLLQQGIGLNDTARGSIWYRL